MSHNNRHMNILSFSLSVALAFACCSNPLLADESELDTNKNSNLQLVEVEDFDSVIYDCNPKQSDCIETSHWEFSINIGVGLRTNPLNDSNNIPLILIPQWRYYSERFFIENLDLGYNLYQDERNQVNLITSPTFDSVFFNRWDPSNFLVDLSTVASVDGLNPQDNLTEINPRELSKRKFSYLGGIEWSSSFDKHILQASWLVELTNHHKGSEARVAYSYKANDYLSLSSGFTWKDKKLTNYFYGVDVSEIVDDRGAYQAEASVNPYVRFSLLTGKDNNSWKISLEYQKLSSEISSSPIANDDYVVTFFVGKQYDWN